MAYPSSILASLLSALALASAALPAAAQEKFVLRFNHVLGPSEPFHKGFTEWAKRVEERTNGGLKIDVFHSAQLGVEEDIIEQIRQGANIGQNTDAARLGNYLQPLAVMNGPYLVSSLDEVWRLSESKTVQGWLDELAAKQGIKVLCFDWVQGFRHFFTNKPVRKPEDLRGLRIRTPPAPIWQESIRALGAAPTSMAFGDMYPGLQQRAIDGVELVYANIPGGRFYEVLKYANETAHIMLINFEVVSAKWFDKLPAEYQAALTEECRTVGRQTSQALAEMNDKIKDDVRGRGMQIVEDVDLQAFRQAGAQAYEKLGLTQAKQQVDADLGR
ncbi:C4-dicarboxylate TRAP transporter substrate-binding protein [Orrella sp. JC864]|uniref:C4-dicarboxylate TRAP transporter substrate-binding protein n=1 Tax=Orrella sp. JC864 TaxID=3120298 RepID=UPI003009064E